jgi:hypothetical protein
MPSVKEQRRKQDRTRAVLPVRVRGKNASGDVFDSLAHTLDLTSTGVRLGSIRQELKGDDTLVVLYRQRRIEFTVVWTKLLEKCGREYQVGLRMATQEADPWGLGLAPVAVEAARATAVSAA